MASESKTSSKGSKHIARPQTQIGSRRFPSHVVFVSYATDGDKMVNSSKIMVTDDESIQAIRAMEQQACEDNPAHTLKSCIGERMVNPEEDQEFGYLVRVKTTKDPSKYTAADPWTTGAPIALNQLDYGSAVLMMCGHQVWTHKQTVGITLYANYIHGVGNVIPAWGRKVTKEVELRQWR